MLIQRDDCFFFKSGIEYTQYGDEMTSDDQTGSDRKIREIELIRAKLIAAEKSGLSNRKPEQILADFKKRLKSENPDTRQVFYPHELDDELKAELEKGYQGKPNLDLE